MDNTENNNIFKEIINEKKSIENLNEEKIFDWAKLQFLLKQEKLLYNRGVFFIKTFVDLKFRKKGI